MNRDHDFKSESSGKGAGFLEMAIMTPNGTTQSPASWHLQKMR